MVPEVTPGSGSTGLYEYKSLLPTCWSDYAPAPQRSRGKRVVVRVSSPWGSALVLCLLLKEYYRDVFGSAKGRGTQCKFLLFANKT